MDCKAIDYQNIPVQPEILSNILQLDAESANCFQALDLHVHSDQGIATLVLRVANSPLYKRNRQIATIPMAISVLGFNLVRSLAMLAFSRSLFAHIKHPLFLQHVWQHSLLTALAGQTICADISHSRDQDEAFLAGLIHDMGKVLMFMHDQTAYLQVLQHVLAGTHTSLEAENLIFGFDHGDVGEEAVKQWQLPEHFVDYMGARLNNPPPAKASSLAHLGVAIANSLVNTAGFGASALSHEDRLERLSQFGQPPEAMAQWLAPAFLQQLMQHDVYQLCAAS